MGNKWTYEVKTDFDSRVDDVAVVSRVPVGTVEGYELASPTGASRLGWNGDVLVMSMISGQVYDPPIPIFSTSKRSWQGTIETAGRLTPAKAELVCQPVKLRFAGRQVDGYQSDLSIHTTGAPVHLTSWFVKGVGLFRQEQRTGERRDRRVEYLSGP